MAQKQQREQAYLKGKSQAFLEKYSEIKDRVKCEHQQRGLIDDIEGEENYRNLLCKYNM